jgi:hypothetical protein
MRTINCEQGTDAWFAARCGVPSSSNFDKIVTMKGELSKQAEKYMFKLAGELVSGRTEESYQNAAMLRGIELEAEARQMYELITGNVVDQVGFCIHDSIDAGCSPDGLVGDDGGMEIKCPSMAVHVEYLLDGKLPSAYYQQVQGSLFISGRKWWDFVSYYPSIKPLIVRVEPDLAFHAALKAELVTFSKELKSIVKRIS